MSKAICTVSVAPVWAESDVRSEMISQLLYGESLEIIENNASFCKIRTDFDCVDGWVDAKQIAKISDENFNQRKTEIISKNFGSYHLEDGETLLSIGSEFNSESGNLLHSAESENMSRTAKQFLNVPHLQGGRSFFGTDCSGFVQLVYKVHGIQLPRKAYQQAEVGQVLDFIEESQPGDLAFFEDSEGKITHVGIMLENQTIIHSFGKVRIDTLDSAGIFNADFKKHTHKLRFVKRIV